MKQTKSLLILLLALCCSLGMHAALRTIEEAMTIAGQFVAERRQGISAAEITQRAMTAPIAAEPMQLAYTQMQYGTANAALYVFTHSNDGFVIVSADDRTRTILGYADGAFDADNIPANMRAWLQMYADEIASLPSTTRRLPSLEQVNDYPAVEPILGNIEWDQDEPFNNHCPIDPSTNERSVVGCVATATAQMMYHYRYPETGVGEHRYYWRGSILSVDFSQANYDWEHMLLQYKEGNYTQVESDAVAELMYHLGVACNMWYSPNSSGATTASSLYALTTYFDYDAAVRVLMKDYMDEDFIMGEIANELVANRPIYIEALTKKHEGHAFVCDGMQSNGYIHINWGWGGYANGYFSLSVMNPINQGIGGASDDGAFTESVILYTGIQPNKGGVTIPTVVSSQINMLSSTSLSKTDKVSFEIIDFQNGGLANEAGNVALLIYKDGNLYRTINTGFDWELDSHHYYSSPVNASATLSNIERGHYELVVGLNVPGKQVEPIYVYEHGVKRYEMNVTSDSIFFEEIVKKNEYFGVEYALMQVTDLSLKTGCNNLRIVMQTEDFELNNKGQVKAGTALSFDVFPTSVNSIIGSYALDATGSKDVGTMSTTFSRIVGLQDGKQINETFVDGVVSISQIVGGHYVIDYHLITADNQSYTGKCKILTMGVNSYKQSATGAVSSYTLTNDQVTAITADRAYTWGEQYANDEIGIMPFFVEGVVSNVETIDVKTGDANFYISATGDMSDALYCYQSKWLGNTDFLSGHEIAHLDVVMLVGYLQYDHSSVPTLHGYVYDHYEYLPPVNTDITYLADDADTYVYDLMGRMVAYRPKGTQSAIELPAAGCYIVRQGNKTTKLMIE